MGVASSILNPNRAVNLDPNSKFSTTPEFEFDIEELLKTKPQNPQQQKLYDFARKAFLAFEVIDRSAETKPPAAATINPSFYRQTPPPPPFQNQNEMEM